MIPQTKEQQEKMFEAWQAFYEKCRDLGDLYAIWDAREDLREIWAADRAELFALMALTAELTLHNTAVGRSYLPFPLVRGESWRLYWGVLPPPSARHPRVFGPPDLSSMPLQPLLTYFWPGPEDSILLHAGIEDRLGDVHLITTYTEAKLQARLRNALADPALDIGVYGRLSEDLQKRRERAGREKVPAAVFAGE